MTYLFTRVYAVLVCFVTMVCITISTGVGLYQIVKIADPELTLSPYRYQHLKSNEAFRQSRYPGVPGISVTAGPEGARPVPRAALEESAEMTDEEIRVFRERELQSLFGSERHEAIASLIRIAIILLVSVPVFLVHWKIAQRYEKASAD